MRNLSRMLVLAAAWLASIASVAAPLPDTSRARQALADLEAPFEGNAGQYDASVAYAARTFAGATFVTHDGQIVHALRDAKGSSGWNLVESLVGGSARPWPTAPSATSVTRLTSRFQGDIPTFRSISLGEPWQGIEVSLQAKGANVEKLFTVAPGVTAAKIRVSLAGAQSLRVEDSGALVVATEGGEVRFTAPIAWQRFGRDRRAVAVSYVTAGTEYGFRLGPHDPAVAVVIDPLLQSTYLGGGSPFDVISGLGLDAAGNVYVAGGTSSFDFPGVAGGAQPTPAGFGVYVAKLSPDLKTLIQATYLGGPFNESVGGLVVDAAGNVFVAGSTSSSSFPGTSGAAQSIYGGGSFDGYVTKLAGDLKSIIRTTFLGGAGYDELAAIAIDAAGDIVVAGRSNSASLPGTAGSAQPANAGNFDGFVARLSGDLQTLVRTTYLGGSDLDQANAVALDSSGFVYVAGIAVSTDLPGTAGGAQPTYAGVGNQDSFIARLSGDLSTLHQTTYLGGAGTDSVTGIAIASGGTIYVAGSTDSPNFPGTAGGAQPSKPASNQTGFVARLANDLKSIVQATYLGGTASDSISAVVLDGPGNVYVVGQTISLDFPGTTGSTGGGGDAFIALLAADLKTMTRAILLGGSIGQESAARIAFDPAGNLIVAGAVSNGSIPGTSGGAQPNVSGGGDAFIARLTADLLGGPAVRFQLTIPANVVVGTSFNVAVRAVDSIGSTDGSYTGTLHWTSTDTAATLPADATLVNGTGTFSVTMETPGSRGLTVTDTVTASITGTASITVNSRPATHFTVTAPAGAFANQAFAVVATARDALGNVATNYSGNVAITSTDAAAVLPGPGSFVNGVRNFTVTLKTLGSATVTVTDATTASITGTSAAIVVSTPVHFVVSAPATSPAGTAFNVTVSARDPSNNIVTGYAGTVRITSSDGQAVLPPDATLTGGIGIFSVTLKTLGDHAITANDAVNTLVTGGSTIVAVSVGPTAALSVSAPPGAAPDAAISLVVTARDAFGNPTPAYSGTAHFTSTDGTATLPADGALASGTGTFSATLRTVGGQTITATDTTTASIKGTSNTIAVSRLVPSVATLDFGGQSMGTTSPPRTLTVTNTSGAPITITGATVSSAQFEQANNCTTLAAGATCTVTLVFKPAATPGALGSSVAVSAAITLTSASGNMGAALAGQAERTLVTHYYRSILRRAPDSGGKAFWEGEAARFAALGANVNETWFAMAQAFYASAEYLAFNRDDTAFVTDLYNTFFNRAPEPAGLGFWLGELNAGLPREVALASFMFSTEFNTFAQAIFGNTAVRVEIDMVTDFYRGLLARLPDSGGFQFWVGRFRSDQCAGFPTGAVETISSTFTRSPEYLARNRNNTQYVGDLYNAFLRRGGDAPGVQFWVNQLNTGRPRDLVRLDFKNSVEFQARVNAFVAQGCFVP